MADILIGGRGSVVAASWRAARRAASRDRIDWERDMVDLQKGFTGWVGRSARRREPSALDLVPGKFVISGRAARCNKPSARNGGVNLHQEVVPQTT